MTSERTDKRGLIWPDHSVDGEFYATNRLDPGFQKCDRAGGGYIITEEAARMLSPQVYSLSGVPLTDAENKFRARLTTILIDRRRSGDKLPVVTQDLIRAAMSKHPLQVHERADRLLRYIAEQTDTVGADVILIYNNANDHQEWIIDAALAWSESTSMSEVDFLLAYLGDKKWIHRGSITNNTRSVALTVDGYGRIEEQVANVDSVQAFVAMWFDETMTDAYEKGMEPAIREAGYTPQRIDKKEHINKIDDEIIAEIRRSRFLIADFTQGHGGARGGVYYESGFAKGLGLPSIFTCRKDCMEELHFDTEHYNHIVWTVPEDLRKKLKNRILTVLGEGPELHRNP